MKTGWWHLEWNSTSSGDEELTELNDIDQEHIGDLIKEGFTSGEIIQEDREED